VSTLGELTRSRELFWNLTLRELRTRYKRSALGWAWSMLNPLATMLIYTFVFVTLLESNAPVGDPSGLKAYGLFILCAILPWNYMAIGVGTSMGTVIGNAGLVKKVAFPREHLVLASVAASLVTLFIELGVLSVVLLFFGRVDVLQIPGLVLAAALLSGFVIGLSLMLSAANVFFRDVTHLWGIVAQVWFFLTPVVYPPEIVEGKLPDWAFWVYEHLPMAIAVDLFRTLLYDGRYPSFAQYGYLLLWSAVMLWLGWGVFKKFAPRFPEEL
jgi:homopolymeric O-antigen transport system permease protein